MKKNKIFVACDTTNIKRIRHIINHTKHSKIKFGYKFGLQFLNSKNGRNFISKLKNKIIFADYKLHDIPNTCASTVKAVKDLNINYLTIHISSGLEALKAAKKVSGKIKLVGVSILTSLDDKSVRQIGFNKKVSDLVKYQAKLASKAKLDAMVCSPLEVKLVKQIFKREIITPGIRFASKSDDQKRIMSPRKALKIGSDWLVIGRPIIKGNIKINLKKLSDHLKK